LYDVNSGDIVINGVPIKDYYVQSLRKRIGAAFQNPNVYALSFADNINLYNEANIEKIAEISKVLGLDDILKKNNAEITSEVTKEFDEKGIILSGGEVQKIGLARIMTGDFGLILLDEPSSALDPIAEYEMNKLILDSSNKSTTIMVAHRLSTIRDTDRIVLVENGTHDELMSIYGKYCEMFTKQSENYIK
jgi:ATP-binding cassette subfamily B protein